jgi:hypothetical protein
MTIVYIVSLLLLLVFQVLIKKQIKNLITGKSDVSDVGSRFIHALAWITAVFAVLFWIFLAYWIINSWMIHIDPSQPKPHFIIVYVLGLFSTGLLISFSQFFSKLNKIKSDSND